MVAWSEYKQAAKERGSLAHELFVVFSTPNKPPNEIKRVLPEHLSYQAKLEQSGTLVFAGPVSDESGEEMQGMGLIVYRAQSFQQAKEIAEADPMHQQQVRTFVLRRWLINEGNLQLNVMLSGQSVSL